MQTPPRIPEARRRGPNGRFLPRSWESSTTEPPTETLMTDMAETAESTATDEVFESDSAPELPEDRFLNRELSWLDFNARVLALAEDPNTQLLERAKFLAIFASNLDEFYMVRVAGLMRRLQT